MRLDSGDLAELSRGVRAILDRAGFPDVQILASGNLDEFTIAHLLAAGAPIDLFAVGTRMGVSADAPYFDIAYKLVEYGGRPLLKLSPGKKTWVGKKQVYRFRGDDGSMMRDELCLLSEPAPQAEPLLETVIHQGKRIRPAESLETIRSRLAADRQSLPMSYRIPEPIESYPVLISEALRQLEEETARKATETELLGDPTD